jgi:hypothetical protein
MHEIRQRGFHHMTPRLEQNQPPTEDPPDEQLGMDQRGAYKKMPPHPSSAATSCGRWARLSAKAAIPFKGVFVAL